jgi:large subunit ribosomal protein L29
MTTASELRDLNDEELAHHLAETREELFSLRFQLAMGKQDNSARLGHVQREVARVLTIQHERESGHNPPAVAPRTSRRAPRKATTDA